jgi:hypothetical protein
MLLPEEFTERVKMDGISVISDISARIESLTYALSRLIKAWYAVSISNQNRSNPFYFLRNLISK